MAEEHARGIAEIRSRISKALSLSFRRFLKTERLRLEEAISLLATDQAIHPESLAHIRSFYESGDAEKEVFFNTLALLEFRKIQFALNQIHATLDSPEWLIQLRADLFSLIKRQKAGGKAEKLEPLKKLSDAFTYHFMQIFNFQYLNIRCCNARNTSIALLKFISEKEGVHPAKNWWSFENRLNSPDHIILTLEHFKMPYIPLVYIEVALADKLIRKIDRIIGEKRTVVDASRATTAIFYSLNTTLPGIKRIGLGGKMIVLAKRYLRAHYPNLRLFATLSPIPKFRGYLDAVLAGKGKHFSLTSRKIDANKHGRFFSDSEIRALREELAKSDADAAALPLSGLLARVLADEKWPSNAVFRKTLRRPLTELTRYYLEREKRVSHSTGERTSSAYDPVENFHLSNGAYIGGINYLANRSEKGLRESYGMMLNYVYDGRQLDRNKLLYGKGKVIVKT